MSDTLIYEQKASSQNPAELAVVGEATSSSSKRATGINLNGPMSMGSLTT